jgi:hypothetical protein
MPCGLSAFTHAVSVGKIQWDAQLRPVASRRRYQRPTAWFPIAVFRLKLTVVTMSSRPSRSRSARVRYR